MLSCAIINLSGFFDLSSQCLNNNLNITFLLTLRKYSDLIKMTPHFQNQCHLKE